MSSTQPEQQALASAQETIKDIQQGNLPSNDEITKGITEVQEVANEQKGQLSSQGKKVLEDTDQLLDTIKRLVNDKNSEEYIQKAFTEAYEAGDKEDIGARRRKIKQIVMSTINSDKAQSEAAQSVDSLMTIARLMVSSPEFRSLINDLETIFEQAFIVDESHPSSAQSGSASTSVTATATVSTTPATTGTSHPIAATAPLIQAPASNTAISTSGTTYRFGQRPEASNPNHDPFHLEPVSAEAYFGADGAKINVGGVTAGDAETSISTDQAAQEAEETLIDHYAKIAHTLNEHPEYRNSINFLINSFDQLSGYLQRKANKLEATHEAEAAKPQNKEADAHARASWANAKAFLENWVGPEYSLDEFLDSIQDIANRAKEDDELANYIKEVRDFFEKSAADREYVQNEERVKEDARQRIRKGRALAQNKYKKEFQRLLKEFEYLNDGIQSDEGVQQLQSDFKQLMGDLFLDENGNATLHTDLLHDLQVMVPSLVKKLRRLPLPEIDFSDETMDLKIKNAVLDCADIAPSHFQFTLRGDTEATRVHNVVQLIISKIRARVIGADFYVNKKTFPKITESGKADFAIYGKNGMTIAMELCPWDVENNDPNAPGLKLKRNVCKISKFDLRLRKTQHDILYAILSPVINAIVKGKVQDAIQTNLRELIEQGSVQVKQAAAQGAQTAKAAVQQIDTDAVANKVQAALN